MTDFETRRAAMVADQIAGRGISDRRLLDAMRAVPRETFVEPQLRAHAYNDGPLPIASGQTISQPYIVALMAEAAELGSDDRVLEVGAGSGYGAAVLSRLAGTVFAIERHAGLAREAAARLAQLGYDNVHVREGDGSLGWPEEAPFDAILVTAGGPRMPESLKAQLAIDGRLVMPVGDRAAGQSLIKLTRRGADAFEQTDLGAVSFVPLIGTEGWRET